MKNINYIVTGSVDAMGNDYAVTVRVLDVSSGQYPHNVDSFMGGGSELHKGVNDLMTKFIAGMSNVADATAAYKIGGPGPAGGIVFYDKGFVTDGWRYMEAAPTDFSAQWGAYGQSMSDTDTSVGSGKRNTQLIVERLKQLGESEAAAQLCAAMDVNGYKDWFLPSKGELNYMCWNLKLKGLGGFGSGWYWSSSQSNNLSAWAQRFFYYGYTEEQYNKFIEEYSFIEQYSFIKNLTGSVRAVRAF